MPGNEYLIAGLAIMTLMVVIVVASVLRGRVAKSKGDPERSSFVKDHGEAPRPNRPGTEH
ncbi:hypothetical protein FV232_28035 [Methylobacterium sp. WL30]|nr:hypothetical protein FV223_03555 [Methylobacterium sp. WL116]TXN38878.1 hypothetical protein FV225_11940 [Methylobacterium sp. WL93]TXN60584.1 hypothetical protein FV232_28035 [Methylobacterium sp. WL30]